jgi:hypothetical protein
MVGGLGVEAGYFVTSALRPGLGCAEAHPTMARRGFRLQKKRCPSCEGHFGVVRGGENSYGFLALGWVAALCFFL